MTQESTGLTGLYFHTFNGDGSFNHQGKILEELEPGVYLVQLYEWFMGDPNGQFVKPLSYFVEGNARFASTHEDWREYADTH